MIEERTTASKQKFGRGFFLVQGLATPSGNLKQCTVHTWARDQIKQDACCRCICEYPVQRILLEVANVNGW
jgi:hypothetical protein